MVDNEAKVKGN